MESNLILCIRNCYHDCKDHIDSNGPLESLLLKLENLQDLVSLITDCDGVSYKASALQLLGTAIIVLQTEIGNCQAPQCVGRPTIPIPIDTVEYLLSLKFKVPDIARIFGVSRDKIFRRLRDSQISVRASYSNITEEALDEHIKDILINFPNTGYKRMKGFLLERGLKITDHRVRQAMRIADPTGVYLRTLCNRAIVRRIYCVTYFNELWHLDTNMKLIRWNIVIRSCIDGKSRLVVYLDASGDNTAESNLISFMRAVSIYGFPQRTRSDKGGENVLIARFMIEQRGQNRASHICGRSVHNQRIERYWRDVFYGYTGALYNTFVRLENEGILKVDNPKHISLLHFVFLPRINRNLETFRNAWNSHPLSSESNYTPVQLMILNLPPASFDKELSEEDQQDASFLCNNFDDLPLLIGDQDNIVSPSLAVNCINEDERLRLSNIDLQRDSSSLGYDIFLEALSCLD